MNKTELIVAVAEKSGLTKKDAERALAGMIEVITETLVNGDKVQLVGFGTFAVRTREARKGHNPMTGAEIDIPQTKTPLFKPGKSLKDAVDA